jgi:hypothetical protein
MLSRRKLDKDIISGFAKTNSGIATPIGVNKFKVAEFYMHIAKADPSKKYNIFDSVSILKHPDEMYSKSALKSLKGIAITENHPDDGYLTLNNKHLIKGWLTDYHVTSDKNLRISYTITDKDLIKKVDSEELVFFSWGISFNKLVHEKGIYKGEPYEFKMVGITYNHLAIVKDPRGGGENRPYLKTLINYDDKVFESNEERKPCFITFNCNNIDNNMNKKVENVLESYTKSNLEEIAKDLLKIEDVGFATESNADIKEETPSDLNSEILKFDENNKYFQEALKKAREKVRKESEIKEAFTNVLKAGSELLKNVGRDGLAMESESILSSLENTDIVMAHTHKLFNDIVDKCARIDSDSNLTLSEKFSKLIKTNDVEKSFYAKLGYVFGVSNALKSSNTKKENIKIEETVKQIKPKYIKDY